jgi:HK97 family phage portal protein
VLVSWFGRTLKAFGLQVRDAASDLIGLGNRGGQRVGSQVVTPESALRHSAVWACLRLRANLVSSMPLDVFRPVGGTLVEVNKPRLLIEPAPGVDITEWMWSTQFDLDRFGNCFGLITERDSLGRPVQVELLAAADVSVLTKGRRITGYRIGGDVLDPALVWHERQYVVAGSPVGLSPIAYAAMSIGGYLSAQQFALDWYTGGAAPAGQLKNTQREISQEVAAGMKARFKVATANRDVFVTGADWEWSPAQGDANSAAFLDEMRYGITDVARFLDVPGDLIDAEGGSSSITYANVTQRNLQFLVLSLAAPVFRRERALSRAVAGPRVVKLNSDAVLRMDPQTRAQVLAGQIAARVRTPDEARAYDNLGPLADEDYAQFDRLWPAKAASLSPVERGWATPWHVEATTSDLPADRLAIGSGWVPPGEGNS